MFVLRFRPSKNQLQLDPLPILGKDKIKWH